MTEKTPEPDDLDLLFAAARQAPAVPTEALLARVAGDAAALQPAAAQAAASGSLRGPSAPGFWPQLREALHGWPALGGLITATLAGLWIGVNPPAAMASAAERYLGLDAAVLLIDLSPEAAFDLRGEVQ